MKIYTRGGDRGRTSLLSGERVAKSHDRIEAYGDLDELNSMLGVLTAEIARLVPQGFSASHGRDADAGAPVTPAGLGAEIAAIQGNLLKIGALLATTLQAEAREALPPLSDGEIASLEAAIDRLEGDLAPLRDFILPGGAPAAAWSHVARCVCRRVERRVVRLFALEVQASHDRQASGAASPEAVVLAYLNRLSDYLFCLARTCNRLAGIEETVWKP